MFENAYSAPSYCLNQCVIVNGTLRNNLQWIFSQNKKNIVSGDNSLPVRHQAITWNNVDLSSPRSKDIFLSWISQDIPAINHVSSLEKYLYQISLKSLSGQWVNNKKCTGCTVNWVSHVVIMFLIWRIFLQMALSQNIRNIWKSKTKISRSLRYYFVYLKTVYSSSPYWETSHIVVLGFSISPVANIMSIIYVIICNILLYQFRKSL